jgi:tetratricopeptide (TPR) repeat protein
MGRKQRLKKERRQREAKEGVLKVGHDGAGAASLGPPAAGWSWLDLLSTFLLLAAASVIVYSNVLDAPFVFDDVTIRDEAFLHAETFGEVVGVLFHESTDRRIGYMTFALNFWLNGLNTVGYHVVNLIIHILVGWLVFWLVRQTLYLANSLTGSPVTGGATGSSGTGRATRSSGTGRATGSSGSQEEHASQRASALGPDAIWSISFFAALLWLVHPVQIMGVTYIVQRLTSLSALLYLAAFAAYVAGRSTAGRKRYVMYALGVMAWLLSLGVKQNVALLPLVVLIYELWFLHDDPWQAVKAGWKWAAGAIAVVAATAFWYLGSGFWASMATRYAERGITPWERLLSESRVLVYYVSLILLPLPRRLNVDYDFTPSRSLIDPITTLPAVIIVLAAIGFAFWGARRYRFLSFAILWFLVNLAVESTVIPVDLAFEHRLYLPSIGLIAVGVGFVYRKLAPLHRYAAPVGLALIAILFGTWTYDRNQVWTDPVLLWRDNAMKSPGKARVHGNLGKAYLDAERYEEAALSFETAIGLDPTLIGAYTNLAVIQIDHFQNYEKATEYLNAALALNPNVPDAYLNLGVIALNTRQLPQAVELFKKVLELDPTNPVAHYNLAACYINLGDVPAALEVIDRGIEYWPAAHRLYLLKGRAYERMGDREAARQALERALELQPDDPEVRFFYEQLR